MFPPILRLSLSSITFPGRLGTPHFMSPEMIQRSPYGKPADVWGAGVLLYLLLSGNLPFYGTKDRLYDSIVKAQLHVSTQKV